MLLISTLQDNELVIIWIKNLLQIIFKKNYLPSFSNPIISSMQPAKKPSKTTYSTGFSWQYSKTIRATKLVGPKDTSLMVPKMTYKNAPKIYIDVDIYT